MGEEIEGKVEGVVSGEWLEKTEVVEGVTEVVSEGEILRLGKDEMNLIEHPFSSLSREKDTRPIETHWKAQHPISKRVLDCYWKVRGDAELGLPTANDEKIYLVAMELTRECNWPREVHFTRADFLRRMGWSDCASSYRQLHEAFLRLSSMMIEARNAFYHPRSGHYIDGAFHLIDNFMIGGEGPGRKSQERLEKPLTFFVWNKMVHESFIAGNIRSIDLNFALSLERPLSLRLFRYLDKKRYGHKRQFEVGLRELCGVHLGMVVENRYDSNLKASLEGAHAELLARGFLSQVRFEKMKTRKGIKIVYDFVPVPGTVQLLGPVALPAADSAAAPLPVGTEPALPLPLGLSAVLSGPVQMTQAEAHDEIAASLLDISDLRPDDMSVAGEQMQLFLPQVLAPCSAPGGGPEAPTPRPRQTKPAAQSAQPDGAVEGVRDVLAARLIAVGVATSVARELCRSFEPGRIELQLDCLADREPKNPAAALVKSIRQGWNPPLAYERRVEAPERGDSAQQMSHNDREDRRREQAEAKVRASEEAAVRQAQQESDAARLDAMWSDLDVPTQESIEAQARDRLGVLGMAGRAPAALNAMRRNLLREREASTSA